MGILTPFFNLFKPAKTDPTAIEQFNDNMDIIDTEMHRPPLSTNGIFPDPVTRNLTLNEVPLAGNLSSDEAQASFGTYIERSSGGAASIADGSAWLVTIKGNSVKTGYVPESLTLTVTPVERQGEDEPITATIDRDTFVSYVSVSGTTTLTYTTTWSADPTLYGVTVSGTPVYGDVITIVYVKLNRGTITSASPSSFNSTGWNLYDDSTGYARVVKYSDEYGFCIAGTYSLLEFAETLNGTRSAVSPVDGYFNVPSDGFVFVTGGNDVDTEIYMTWSDWTDPTDHPAFEAYDVDTISVASIMVNFPYGLMSVGVVKDEINLNAQTAISRINRLAYTDENLETVIESGMDYDVDENYIYVVRETPVTSSISLDGEYTVSDHGIEFFAGTTVPAEAETLYGQDLKGKLRRDVLTISAQELTATQKAQVLENIGAASESEITTLSDQIAKKLSYKQVDISTTAKTLTVELGSQIVLVTASGYSANRGMYILSTGTTSGLYKSDVLAASGITITINNLTMSIATSANTAVANFFIMSGSITEQ